MSNEQRAHDLTMLYVKENLKPSFEELRTGKSTEDICDLYFKIYPKVLEKVNHAFPKIRKSVV